ncbi:MAG: hypothetical protein AB7O86_05625 [Porticoccaceae bacterium]
MMALARHDDTRRLGFVTGVGLGTFRVRELRHPFRQSVWAMGATTFIGRYPFRRDAD